MFGASTGLLKAMASIKTTGIPSLRLVRTTKLGQHERFQLPFTRDMPEQSDFRHQVQGPNHTFQVVPLRAFPAMRQWNEQPRP